MVSNWYLVAALSTSNGAKTSDRLRYNCTKLSNLQLFTLEFTLPENRFQHGAASSERRWDGKNPLRFTVFCLSKCAEPRMLWEHWINRFKWGVITNHAFNTTFYFAKRLTTAQITAVPPEVLEKTRVEVEQTLVFNLYQCLRERGQDELHNRKPHLDLGTTRYPRIPDEFKEIFKNERNETFETYLLFSRKQRGKGITRTISFFIKWTRGQLQSWYAGTSDFTG